MTNTGNIIKIIKVESNISKNICYQHTVNATIFVVGTFDIFDFSCKR